MIRRVAALAALLPLCAYIVFLQLRYFQDPAGTPRHRLESPFFILAAVAVLAAWLMERDEPSRAAVSPAWRRPVALCAAATASFALYWPTLSVGLLSDDYALRRWAAAHDFAGTGHEFVRPLPLVLWSAVLAAGGGATAIHATLLLLHGANAVMAGELAMLLGLGGVGAVTTMAVFLAWPTQVEPLAWASGISDITATALCLGAVLLLARPRPGMTQIAGAAVLALGAMLSKESAVALPILASAVLLVRRRSLPLSRSQVTALALVTSTAALYGIWRVLIRARPDAATAPALSRYAMKELVSRTFAGVAVPFTSDTIAATAWVAFLFASVPLAIAIGSLAGLARRTREHEAAIAALLWALAAAAPAIGFLIVDSNLAGSRYLYLPAAGWALWLAALATLLWRRLPGLRPVVVVAAAAMIAAAAWQGRMLQRHWIEAANLRDAILSRASEAVARGGCGSTVFDDLPAMHRGAQLFRNGFDEAFAERQGPSAGSRTCRFRWNGVSFDPE